jgi:hypothetical protein
MASWKFTDDFATKYPALQGSILAMLEFSSHTLNGTAFTGTLDVAGSGPALATLGLMLNMTSIDVSGTVTDANDALTVSLISSDTTGFTSALAAVIPIIGGNYLRGASMTIATTTTTTETVDEGPGSEAISLNLTFAVGSSGTVTVSSPLPMNQGFFSVTGTFQGVGISLDDLNFLFKGQPSSSWFPATDLGPYASGTPAFELLSVTLHLYVTTNPLEITPSSITVSVGITNIPLMGQKLYLDPLAVIITVPLSSAAEFTWGLEGSIVLCNYARPGDTANPDFVYDLQMSLTEFTLSGTFENKMNLSVNTMVQDLLGQGTSVGLPATLTIDQFDFFGQASKTNGSLQEFSTDIAMSGGFGLFENFDLLSFAFRLGYTA